MSDHSPHFNPNFIEYKKEVSVEDQENNNFRRIGESKVPTNEYLLRIQEDNPDEYLYWANLIPELEETERLKEAQEQLKNEFESTLNYLNQEYPNAKLNPSLIEYKGNGIYIFKGNQINFGQLEDEFKKFDELYKKPEGKFERIQSYGRGQD